MTYSADHRYSERLRKAPLPRLAHGREDDVVIRPQDRMDKRDRSCGNEQDLGLIH